MTYYRKKPIIVQAHRWFKNGDHPNDFSDRARPSLDEVEGLVVRYYRTPDLDGREHCKHCSNIMHLHGWIDTSEGGHIVCPGDWIITGINGELYPCKPDIFEKTYEPVES